MKKTIILLVGMFFLIANCRKKDSPCDNYLKEKINFDILEPVGDTSLATDTVFQNRLIEFSANQNLQAIKWKIGDDPRVFTTALVPLSFNANQTINVSLDATLMTPCQYQTAKVEKTFTVVKDDGSVISPLVGTYSGYNTENKTDTFSVSIKFWIGPRYIAWKEGAYTIHNIPKGYKHSLGNVNGVSLPEIDGILGYTGYKNMAINELGLWKAQGIKGYCSLKQGLKDTLIINYSLLDTLKAKQTGIYSYFQKKFIGLRKS